MAIMLKGAPVAAALSETIRTGVESLRIEGITPLLAILRVGERKDDVYYERSAVKKCAEAGIDTKCLALTGDASQAELLSAIDKLNRDSGIHGILLMRPLPAGLDETAACEAIDPAKDVDGVTPVSLADIYRGKAEAFAPCTASACIEMLKYYDIPLCGRHVVVIGRSLNVGKPAAMLLVRENATVTLCNSHTKDLPEIVRSSEVVVSAAGKAGLLGPDCLSPGQVVVDVGVNWDAASGKFVGDLDFDAAEPVVSALTPVPGGVGTVTTAVLAGNVVKAAARQAALREKAIG